MKRPSPGEAVSEDIRRLRMRYFKKLVGERIFLSPMNVDDADTYTRWLNDFNVTDGLGNSSMITTIDSEKEWLKSNTNTYQFAIVETDGENLLGNCGLQNIDLIRQAAEVGLFIGDAENRSKGYGTEALNLILAYGFDYLNLNNIMLKVFAFNEVAINCYKKVGFKEIGRRRQSYYKKGDFFDEIYMDILREEYIA